MSQFKTQYQETILKDVQSAHYEKRRNAVWYSFFAVWGVSLSLYLIFLIGRLIPVGFDFMSLVAAFQANATSSGRIILWFHETAVLVVGFFVALAAFALVGFFIYDLQQRNELIRRQIGKEI